MNRPSDIPQHIYEWAEIFCAGHASVEDDRELVARAFMAGQGRPVATGRPGAGLTIIQAEALDFIERYQAANGASPSYGDIGRACGIASKSGVHRVVHALADRGAVAILPGRGRSISIICNVSSAHKNSLKVA